MNERVSEAILEEPINIITFLNRIKLHCNYDLYIADHNDD